jgi:hypothetical protein
MKFFRESTIPTYWFIAIFGIKVVVSVLLTSIYSNYYTDRDTADIFKYFDDSYAMFEAIKTNPWDYLQMILGIDHDHVYFSKQYYQYMNHWNRPYSSDLISDSHIIIRFNAFIRLFSFGHFQVHNVFMNFISLLGLTAIFKTFKPAASPKEKALFYVIFLIPSVLFWGSGLLKESIIFFAFGMLLYYFVQFINVFRWYKLIPVIIGIGLIIFTKLYILVALLIPGLGFIFNRYFRMKFVAVGYIVMTAIMLALINILPFINDRLDFVFQIVNKQQAFSRFIQKVPTNSGFFMTDLSDGFSVLKAIPSALLNTLVRPFFWECNSLFMWLSAIENIVTLGLILLALLVRNKLTLNQKNVMGLCLVFAISLFILIGLTTPVFGAIVRYKVPGMIMLMIALLLLVDLEKIKRLHPLLKKIL